MEVEFDVQVNDDLRSNDPQNGFIAGGEEDIEELLDNMVIVGEDREEDIQWDRVVNAVEDINSSQQDDMRGVDQILRQDSGHGNHNQNPIRMWANPDANEIEATVYRPGQDTLLSDVDAVEAFNQIFNNQSAPTQTLQVAGEEHYLNQNSEALGSFEDISTIRWAILEEAGAHGEEAPRQRAEHLTTNTNTQYEIHGFYIEQDGQPLDPEEVNSLMKKIVRRDQFNVTSSEPSEIPEIMLEYDSAEEAIAERDLDREEFASEYDRAKNIGLVTEQGDLTLKGWLSAADMQARDIRALEETARGSETVEFESDGDLGLDLTPSRLRGRARLEADIFYINSRRLRSPSERGEIELEQNAYSEDLKEFLEEYSWVGFEPDADPTEPQNVEEEISLARYLVEFEDAEINRVEEGVFRIGREDVGNRIFSQLHDIAIGPHEGVTVTDADVDYEVNLRVEDYSGDEVEDISPEESQVSTEILNEIQSRLEQDLEFESGELLSATSNVGEIGGDPSRDRWDTIFDYDDGMTTQFEENIGSNSIVSLLLRSRHGEELRELKEDYETSKVSEYIPFFDEASDSIIETANELEERGLVETKVVEENEAELEITANETRYRETIEKLEQIDAITFDRTERVSGRHHTRHRVPLESVTADFEVSPGKEEEVRERLQGYEEELEQQLYIPKRREVKDSIIPQLKKYVNEEIDSQKIEKILGKVIPEPDYGDKREVYEHEDHLGSIQYAELEENQEGNVSGFDKCLSEELLEELGEMHREGIIEAELDYDVETDSERETDRVPIPGKSTITNYRELDEGTKEELRELDRRGLINLSESDYHLELNTIGAGEEITRYEPSEKYDLIIEGEAEVTELEVEDEPVELEGEYETTEDTIYEADQEVLRIAESLHPWDFEDRSFEDVEIDTGFTYEDSAQAAL